MITMVRFPSAVEVVKGADARSTWQVGGCIVRIEREPSGVLVFMMNVPGDQVLVYPLPGTVVTEWLEPSKRSPELLELERRLIQRADANAAKAQPAKAADAAIAPVNPPPARPIDKPARKGR